MNLKRYSDAMTISAPKKIKIGQAIVFLWHSMKMNLNFEEAGSKEYGCFWTQVLDDLLRIPWITEKNQQMNYRTNQSRILIQDIKDQIQIIIFRTCYMKMDVFWEVYNARKRGGRKEEEHMQQNKWTDTAVKGWKTWRIRGWGQIILEKAQLCGCWGLTLQVSR